jgi:ABC-type spermidine/putrescine transport system permease subunit I
VPFPRISIYLLSREQGTRRSHHSVRPSPKTMSLETTQRPITTTRAVGSVRRPAVHWFPYLLLLPSLAMICLVELYPFLSGVSYSLHKGTLLGVGAFVGWQNYERLFSSPDFYHSLWFSFIFALFNVVFSYLIGLALALFLNLDFPGRGFCRVFLLLPWIVPAVVSIVSWKWLIADRGGLVNIVLSDFGLGPIYFLSQGNWPIVAVIVIKIWRSFPFMMLSLLAVAGNRQDLIRGRKNRRRKQLGTLSAHHDASSQEHLHHPGHPHGDLEH